MDREKQVSEPVEQEAAGKPGVGEEPGGLPSGTVTFLFTDIEGSTRLLEQLREGYAQVLAEQRQLLREVFQRWRGHEVDTQGDSFFVAFGRATDAITCAMEAQQCLYEHSWPQGVSVKVRMGLHTGEPLVAKTGYVGMDVHRAFTRSKGLLWATVSPLKTRRSTAISQGGPRLPRTCTT